VFPHQENPTLLENLASFIESTFREFPLAETDGGGGDLCGCGIITTTA
jgi:hypothetical protein